MFDSDSDSTDRRSFLKGLGFMGGCAGAVTIIIDYGNRREERTIEPGEQGPPEDVPANENAYDDNESDEDEQDDEDEQEDETDEDEQENEENDEDELPEADESLPTGKFEDNVHGELTINVVDSDGNAVANYPVTMNGEDYRTDENGQTVYQLGDGHDDTVTVDVTVGDQSESFTLDHGGNSDVEHTFEVGA